MLKTCNNENNRNAQSLAAAITSGAKLSWVSRDVGLLFVIAFRMLAAQNPMNRNTLIVQ